MTRNHGRLVRRGFSRWRGIFRGLLLAVEYKFLAKLERAHEATMRIVLLDSFTVKLGSAIPLALNQPDYKNAGETDSPRGRPDCGDRRSGNRRWTR